MFIIKMAMSAIPKSKKTPHGTLLQVVVMENIPVAFYVIGIEIHFKRMAIGIKHS